MINSEIQKHTHALVHSHSSSLTGSQAKVAVAFNNAGSVDHPCEQNENMAPPHVIYKINSRWVLDLNMKGENKPVRIQMRGSLK